MNALEIRGLSKNYPGFQLDNLNLELPSGCIMGLIGENGAGKSTTMKLILNMIQRDSGTITILGKDNQENMKLTKEDVGVVLDEVGFPECFNARMVNSIMKNTFQNWEEQKFYELLQKLSVPDKKAFKDFSRGMKMKLGIAVALAHKPKLLLLDEATSGLDPVVRDEVLDMFSEFTRDENHAILISSHIVSDLEKICDYIAFLHKGKLLLSEEKDLLMEQYGIIRCSREQFLELSADAVLGKKESAYGVEAIVQRNRIPSGMNISPVNIEELFLFMVKEER
ncbi:ABC transporter ATP-binding protein [Roseburia sp. 499]|uniref:ABC transporter ATP-binding protein n=1 Tax=Roseburia sp. 499 TaxID=1261634 RepID=UPI0009535409|nr:ABC transporter ATP-binding protein [Roseburia sp. 499]WVK71143.1 ABC transporter ATP-binding protein [Roseburia sp. 499]